MKLFRHLRALVRKKTIEADMAEEMRAHLERRIEANLAAGMAPEEARYAAQRQFGGVDQLQEVARDERGWRWLEELGRDVRQALRSLLKQPGFVFAALGTLALCLGANLAIFAVVQATLLRPLPFPDADRLVTLYYTYPKLASATKGASLTNYHERRGKISAFSSLAEIAPATSVVGEPGATAIENLGRVTPEFFATLGVSPFLGRGFTDAEMTYQTDHVAMISYEYWQSRFNADPDILNKSVRLDGIPRAVVGVLPPGFRFLSFQAPVYMPLSSEEAERDVGARHSIGKILIARLADGATLADATAQVAAHDAAIADLFPDAKVVADAGCYTVVAPLQADQVAAVRPTLLLLQAAALCLLLIGGVNLVNLLLVRASGRARELAIRQALGASWHNVVRGVMTETLLLTAAGAALGLGVGAAAIKLIGAWGNNHLPLGGRIVFDGSLAVVAFGGAVGLGVAVGVPVVWFNLRRHLGGVLQSEARGSTASGSVQRVRQGFIVAQVGLAFLLLTGAGLLGLSLQRAMAISPGFRSDHVITGKFNLTWFGYHNAEAFRNFFDPLYEKARRFPGITATGAISSIPVSGPSSGGGLITVPGSTAPSGDTAKVYNFFGVAGDYFSAMGIPLREGRYLDHADTAREQLVCVVDENFARHHWPEGGGVGRLIYQGTDRGPENKPFTVVGVVGAVKQSGLTERENRGAVYFPYTQTFNRTYFLVARTTLEPESLALPLGKLIREIDPDVPLTDLRSMQARVDDSLSDRRSPTVIAGIFALTALFLAAIGLYGVMAYSVAQRTSEFGLRMALGAQRGDVLRLVFRQGARLIALGLGLGLIAALLLSRTWSTFLFQVRATDPMALGGVAALLAVVAVLACLLPARRATRVDPLVALRAE